MAVRRAALAAAAVSGALGVSRQLFPESSTASQRSPTHNVPKPLEARVKTMAKEMGIPNADEIKVFISTGLSAMSAGSTFSTGAVIGVPRTALALQNYLLAQEELVLGGRQVVWDTELGRRLLRSLVPSDEALAYQLAFSIAHELVHIQKNDPLFRAALLPACILFCWLAWEGGLQTAVQRLPPAFRIPVQVGMLAAAGAGTYSLMVVTNRLKEFRADRVAVDSDPSGRLAKGAEQFFLKRLEMQSIIREMTGKGDASGFTADGEMIGNYSHPLLRGRMKRIQS
eukprot:jgi/Chlat1/6469/Chrsp45S09067